MNAFLKFCGLGLFSTISFIFMSSISLFGGGIDSGRLEELKSNGSPNYKAIAEAVSEAVLYSSSKPIMRSKLPGAFRFYFETGVSALDVNDEKIALVSKLDANNERFSPDGYELLHGKMGVGLPYGIIFEAGTTYSLSEHDLGAVFGNIGIQAFDFDRMVVTDMVPSIAFASNVSYTYRGPSAVSFGGSALIGGYHRYWFAQVNYIFQLSYTMLRQPSYSKIFIRHGLSSYWPLYEGLHLSTEVYYRPIQVGLSLGYLF